MNRDGRAEFGWKNMQGEKMCLAYIQMRSVADDQVKDHDLYTYIICLTMYRDSDVQLLISCKSLDFSIEKITFSRLISYK